VWNTLKPYTIELLRIAWNDAVEDGIVEGAFDVDNPYVKDTLATIARRITGIDDTTRDLIRAIVGQTELSTAEKRERLMELMGTTPARAEMIARTETASAHSAGSVLAYQASGVVTGIEWIAESDACDICAPLNGMVVKLGDEFAPGIQHPSAHPSCRCAIAPRVD
jgi:SPP1 gp7 family putative phage head morphogenesis protein